MRNIIKKIIRESLDSDWSWTQFDPSLEMFHGAQEVNNGYLWTIDSFNDWYKIYHGLESLQLFNTRWSLRPDLKNSHIMFNSYLTNKGNFYVFLPHNKENLYAWFENLGYALDKDDNYVKIPI
jgi:hypothetical protein